MPRKSTRKETKETPRKDVDDVKLVDQESTPRRSGRPERSRRSSTAALTTSEVDSKGSKTPPTEGRRSSARESNVESPAVRAKSSRRAASRINYKESDGEEEVSTPKAEEVESNYEESDSDDTTKKASKRTKSSTKGRGAKQKGKPKGKGGRKSKKSETVVITDESADDFSDSEKKSKRSAPKTFEVDDDDEEEEETRSSRRKSKKSASESASKPGRRSARTPAIKEVQEPINKRPSRNKQIKKYTEVDEDFSDAKSEDDVVYETEVKKDTSRKRKRDDTDDTSRKNQKRRKSSKSKSDDDIEEIDNADVEEIPSKKEAETVTKKEESGKDDTADSEEPMEVDEEPRIKKSPMKEKAADEESKSKKDEVKHEDDKLNAALVIDEKDTKIETNEKIKSDDKKDNLLKDEQDDTQHSKTSSQYSEEGEDSEEEESEHHASDVPQDESVKPVGDNQSTDTKAAVNCVDTKSEKAFPNKDNNLETSVNGDNVKPTVITPCPPAPTTDTNLRTHELPPKQNGSHEISSPQNYITSRRYVINPSLTEDVRLSLKDKTFGIASYNLQGSEAVNKDKLIQELSKLQASVICFQDVSRALYHEVLESNLDILGFKGTGSWLKGSQHTGLATFYKTSAFRFSSSAEISLQKLIEQEVDASSMDQASRESFYRTLSKCGNALLIVLSSVFGDRQLIVGNADLPCSNANIHTLQVSCLSQELVKMSGEAKKPLILCGELNVADNKIPYQLLRYGSLTENMLDELRSKTESPSEAAALENSLKRSFLRPSCKMLSCYATVLGKELYVPSTQVTSSNMVWFVPDCLHTIGVLDIAPESPDADDYPISLKADVAFSI